MEAPGYPNARARIQREGTQYISHAQHDFGSLLKFIEGTFGLPSLGYADAAADDLSVKRAMNQERARKISAP